MMMSVFLCADKSEFPISDHFDGTLFHNVAKTEKKTLMDVMRWRFTRTPARDSILEMSIKTHVPKPINESNDIAVTFVGHSTFLLQANKLNVLTDPIWSERCSPISFLGPKRLVEPGIRFDELPKIDVVIISHNHYDHMDMPTLVRLWQRDHPVFIVPLRNRTTLTDAGIGHIVEQDWWDEANFHNGLSITAVPAQHWSGRWIIDRNEALWAGFVLSFGKKNVFFAGDTGFGPHFSAIKERFKDFDLALLPIGAFLPRWFMRDNHLSPKDALKAAEIIQARDNIPMHFGTFALGDDGFTMAEKELRSLMAASTTKFTILAPGAQY
jgi:L-ascorbate metabolism protein UlaG (beta-lactamase superfamily)